MIGGMSSRYGEGRRTAWPVSSHRAMSPSSKSTCGRLLGPKQVGPGDRVNGQDDTAVCLSGSRRLDSPVMADVTLLLSAVEAGDLQAAAELLPLVYDELRK